MPREISPENGFNPTRVIPWRSKDSKLFKSEIKFKKELKIETKEIGFSRACTPNYLLDFGFPAPTSGGG